MKEKETHLVFKGKAPIIARMYDDGTVLIGEKPLEDLSIEELRQAIRDIFRGRESRDFSA